MKSRFSILLFFVLALSIFSCKEKVSVEPTPQLSSRSITVDEAKAWFESNFEKTSSRTGDELTREIIWDYAVETTNTDGNQGVRVPVAPKKWEKVRITINRPEGQTQLWLQEQAVIFSDEDGKEQLQLLQFSTIDPEKRWKDLSDFDGWMLTSQWNGSMIKAERWKNGELLEQWFPSVNSAKMAYCRLEDVGEDRTYIDGRGHFTISHKIDRHWIGCDGPSTTATGNNPYGPGYLPIGNWWLTGGGSTINTTAAYSEAEITGLVNALSNPLTGDGIELYLVMQSKASKFLSLGQISRAGNAIQVGTYSLVPHYDKNNNLIFYAASRTSNGVEYIIRADQLNQFTNKIDYYTSAANLVYFNGVPSPSQVSMISGDYFKGLVSMWGDAVKSPEYWLFLATALVTQPQLEPVIRTTVNQQPVTYRLQPVGLGSTGRTVANNLTEDITMRSAMRYPEFGREIIPSLNDARWPGWSKMEYKIKTAGDKDVIVHYVAKWQNGNVIAVDDFKFKP